MSAEDETTLVNHGEENVATIDNGGDNVGDDGGDNIADNRDSTAVEQTPSKNAEVAKNAKKRKSPTTSATRKKSEKQQQVEKQDSAAASSKKSATKKEKTISPAKDKPKRKSVVAATSEETFAATSTASTAKAASVAQSTGAAVAVPTKRQRRSADEYGTLGEHYHFADAEAIKNAFAFTSVDISAKLVEIVEKYGASLDAVLAMPANEMNKRLFSKIALLKEKHEKDFNAAVEATQRLVEKAHIEHSLREIKAQKANLERARKLISNAPAQDGVVAEIEENDEEEKPVAAAELAAAGEKEE